MVITMDKNYEAVTKVVDNTISTIVPDVHEFVYKVKGDLHL